jgi:hypothetical protein
MILQNKIILSILVTISIVGIIQFAYAEENKEASYIAVDIEEFEQPQSKYNYKEITIFGHIEDYNRGEKVSIVIIKPNEIQEEISTFASKKGKIYTFSHITSDSQIGIHKIVLSYHKIEIASTSFEILESTR